MRSTVRRPSVPPLLPYTTLFRSGVEQLAELLDVLVRHAALGQQSHQPIAGQPDALGPGATDRDRLQELGELGVEAVTRLDGGRRFAEQGPAASQLATFGRSEEHT